MTIAVKRGDIGHEDVDAIGKKHPNLTSLDALVNITDSQLSFEKDGIWPTLPELGGPEIEQKCQDYVSVNLKC